MITTTNQYTDAKEAEVHFNEDAGTHRPTRVVTIAPMTGATATAATTTAVTIGTVVVNGQKDPSLVNITAADQTISSPLLTNLAPSATMTSNTRRSSMACALSTRTPSIR